MFFRKEANCERMAFIRPPKPRSPVMICPMASAAATMLSARNFDTCASKLRMASLIFEYTSSRADSKE